MFYVFIVKQYENDKQWLLSVPFQDEEKADQGGLHWAQVNNKKLDEKNRVVDLPHAEAMKRYVVIQCYMNQKEYETWRDRKNGIFTEDVQEFLTINESAMLATPARGFKATQSKQSLDGLIPDFSQFKGKHIFKESLSHTASTARMGSLLGADFKQQPEPLASPIQQSVAPSSTPDASIQVQPEVRTHAAISAEHPDDWIRLKSFNM